jgi:hypothetical protein
VLNKDYKEMLQILSENKVRYLIVGAYAMSVYGYPRGTGDLDIWVDTSEKNAENLYKSLAKFGAPVSSLSEKTFTEENVVFQIGVVPRRIDILTSIDGVNFKDAYSSKKVIEVSDIKIPFISKADLIR